MSNNIYYVYIYRDPSDGTPFYVGKGTGDRMYHHLKESKNRTDNYLKWCKIESIKNQGKEPLIEIYMETTDENKAYEIEAELISFYGRKAFGEGCLTNMCLDNRPPTYAARMPRSETYRSNMSKAKLGDKNGMFGKEPWNKNKPGYSTAKKGQKRKWVTNGKEEKQILREEEIPEGWRKGRCDAFRALRIVSYRKR